MSVTDPELLVVGGGVAGVSAAVAAARSGVKTLLVERQEYLGGTGYAGLLQHICGLYLNGGKWPAETLNGGLTAEIVARLKKIAPEKEIRKLGQVFVLPFAGEDLQTVLISLCEGEVNLTLRCGFAAKAVEAAEGRVRRVTLDGPGGEQTVAPALVIDCTGSGAVAAMAGADFELSPYGERQLAGFTIRVAGLKWADETLAIKVPYWCSRGVAEGTLAPLMKFTAFSPGDGSDEGFCKMSLDGDDGPDREALAEKSGVALLVYLARVLPPFSSARIAETSLRVQEREGRRIRGDYTLTEEDIITARKFPDGVVRNTWPIELWDREKGTVYRYVPRGEYYEIPLRSLAVKGFSNLLTAGRCISVSHAALGSTRVMGTCMALGEQAGLAGARFVKTGRLTHEP